LDRIEEEGKKIQWKNSTLIGSGRFVNKKDEEEAKEEREKTGK
jgi:hypothetical protein